MATLSHRERVVKALNHEEPDRVPMDLGSTPATTVVLDAYPGLVRQLGLADEPSGEEIPGRKYAQIATLSEAVLQRLDVDLGMQDMCLVRPELYRRLIKPRHRKLVEAIKSKTKAKVLMHNCGSLYPIIGNLIDIGVDALNPVQVSARQMDTGTLKREFGDHLSFWGAIDTQQVLPWGTVEEVEAEVRTRIGDLAPGGGYVAAAVHNVQEEVPPENVVAMYDTARNWGAYS